MTSTRRVRVLRAVEDLGSATVEEVRLFVGWTDPGVVLRYITDLERQGLLEFSPITARYSLTQKATMRRNRRSDKNSTNSPSATVAPGSSTMGSGGERITPPDALVISDTAAGATGHDAPAAVVNLNAKADALVYEMEGDEGLALHILRDEVDLWERLSAALSGGAFQVPALLDLPSRRRVAAIEEALDTFDRARTGGPCSACGAVVPPRTRYVSGGYLTAEEPSFYPTKRTEDGFTALCAFCFEYLGAGHTTEDLRERVGNALAGVASAPGPGSEYRFAHKILVPFFHEVEGGVPGVPWGHLTAVQRRAVELRAEATIHPSRFIRTVGQAQMVSLPGIEAPIHAAPQSLEYVAPVVLRPEGPTPAEEQQAVEQFHTTERDEFLLEHRRYDESGAPLPLEDTATWTALLARQQAESKSPSLLRQRVGSIEAPTAPARPATQPPRVTRREPSPEALLSARQTAEREAYLLAHPTPAVSLPIGDSRRKTDLTWGGRDGWTALLARHKAEADALSDSRDEALRHLEIRQASSREVFLRSNPRPRHGGDWGAAEGWAALMDQQAEERRRLSVGSGSPDTRAVV